MAEHEASRSSLRRFGVVLVVTFVVLILLVVIAAFLPRKPSPAAAALDANLAQLRADGVPLSSDELAKAFPDPAPEHDGSVVLRDALAWAPRGNVSPLLPFVGGGAMPVRSERISDAVMQALDVHLSNSDAILDAIPKHLTNVWFSTGWAAGGTNVRPLVEIRAVEQTLALKAIYEAELGNTAKATEALQKGFAVASALGSDSLVNTMIEVACAGIMSDAAEQALNRAKFEDQHLSRLAGSLPIDAIASFDGALTAERAIGAGFLESLRKVHDAMNQDRLQLAFSRLINVFSRFRKPFYRDEDYLLFLKAIEEMKRLESKPMLQRVRDAELLTTHFETNAQSTVIAIFFPNITKATLAACETKARLVALKTALAIERFRLANSNALPATLEALVPTYCTLAPRDPFDEQSLRYKKLDRGYVVYSIGGDGVDNGGAERTDPKKRSGYDVTITIER